MRATTTPTTTTSTALATAASIATSVSTTSIASLSTLPSRAVRRAADAARASARAGLVTACVCCGTMGGAIAGAVRGALYMDGTPSGVVRGAVRGAHAAVVTLLETLGLNAEGARWRDEEARAEPRGDDGRVYEYFVLVDEHGIPRVVQLSVPHASMTFGEMFRELMTREATFEALTARSAIGGGTPARVVESIPKRTFRKRRRWLASGRSTHETMTCAVCLETFEDGDTVRSLPRCAHEFHAACVDRWLKKRDACPICRRSIEEIRE